MKIQKIEIKNVLGIKELTIEAGELNYIKGKNSAGKTSVIEAIKSSLSGGNDATLINKDSGEAELVIVFDNNYELRRKIRRDKNPIVNFKDGNGHLIPSPQSSLEELYSTISVNPVEFINSKPKERLEELLKVLPVQITKKELKTIISDDFINTDLTGIELIDTVRSDIYSQRTAVNRECKKSEAEYAKLQEEKKHYEAVKEPESQKEQFAKLKKLEIERNNELDSIKDKAYNKIKEIESLASEEIEKLKNKIAEIRDFANEKTSKIQLEASENCSKLKEGYSKEINEAKNAIEEHEKKQAEYTRKLYLEEKCKEAEKYYKEKADESERMTKMIKELDEYKASQLSEIPIKGLEIKDGEIYVGGVAFDRLNTAKQIEVAVDVARLANEDKDIKIMCVDGIERFDKENLKHFEKKIKSSGIQCFITRVTDDVDLKVEAKNG